MTKTGAKVARWCGVYRGCAGNSDGVAAIEFALVAPIFCLIVAAVVDFGGVLYVRFSLNGALSAAANYSLINAQNVNATNGQGFATNIVAVLTSSSSADGTVTVNNGPTATLNSGVVSTGGVASSANACYCPTGSSSNVAWGTAVTCGSACSGEGSQESSSLFRRSSATPRSSPRTASSRTAAFQ